MRPTLQLVVAMALRLPPGLTLYFARHGQTLANIQGRFQGWTVDTPLTTLGIEQARALGLIVAREVAEPTRLEFIASPLPRARRTMELVLETLGLDSGRFVTDERLAEINLGSWDGLTHQEACALDPAAYAKREADKWNVCVPGGGENYAQVSARAADWIAGLQRESFAVSHGAFTRILRGLFGGLDWKQMSDLDEPQGCVFRARENNVTRLDLSSQ
jgi:probable phosphoglycerate mutase